MKKSDCIFKDFKEFMEWKGYSYKDFDRCEDMDNLIEEYTEDKISKLEQTPAFSNVSGRWVSVKDRLPEYSGEYICCLENGAVTYCFWYDIGKEWHLYTNKPVRQHNKVTHWMPLPPKPIDA